MIPFRALRALPFTTLRALAQSLSRDIDAGEPDKRECLERVFKAMQS